MAILSSVLSQATSRQEVSALIDVSDCFDWDAAESAGVDLSRLLWVRCGKKRKPNLADHTKTPEFRGGEGKRVEPVKSLTALNLMESLDPLEPMEQLNPMVPIKPPKPLKPLGQAFKVADILIQNGGLGLIVIDLGNIEEHLVRKIPLTTWFRFARVVEKQPTALVVFATYPAAQSCAALTLHIKDLEMHWKTEANSETQVHSNQKIPDGVCSAASQDCDDAQQQVIDATCHADHKALTHTQLFSGLTFEVEAGRVRGQGGKPAQSLDADLWCLQHGVKNRS